MFSDSCCLAHRMKAYGRFCSFFNWLWFCFTLNAGAIFQETRGKLILTGTQFGRRSLKCLGPEKSWNTVGTSAHQCASCLPVNGLHIAKNRSFQILHLQGVSKIQNWHAPAISRGLTRSHDSDAMRDFVHRFQQIYSKTVVDFSDNWCTTDDQLENPPPPESECTCERRDLFLPRNLASRISHVAAPLPWLRLWSVI